MRFFDLKRAPMILGASVLEGGSLGYHFTNGTGPQTPDAPSTCLVNLALENPKTILSPQRKRPGP